MNAGNIVQPGKIIIICRYRTVSVDSGKPVTYSVLRLFSQPRPFNPFFMAFTSEQNLNYIPFFAQDFAPTFALYVYLQILILSHAIVCFQIWPIRAKIRQVTRKYFTCLKLDTQCQRSDLQI